MLKWVTAASLSLAVATSITGTAGAQVDWAQEIADCADADGMTETSASAGGADVVVASGGGFVTAEVFAGAGGHVSAYVSCIVDAGLSDGWLFAVMRYTSDNDGLQALAYDGGWTILWQIDAASNVMLIIVTTAAVSLS